MDDDFNKGMELSGHDVSSRKKKPAKIKKILFVLLLLALFALLATASWVYFFSGSEEDLSETSESSQADKKTNIRFIATGDMIPHDAINQEAQQADGSYSYSSMFGSLGDVFSASEVNFCNQAVLAGGSDFNITGYPIFNSPTEFSEDMAALGCNVINKGTNHTNDINQEVINASVSAWDDIPNVFAVAGANRNEEEKNKIRYFSVEGVDFAFVSYSTYSKMPSPESYSLTMFSDELARKQLSEAQEQADIVIVSMRWGVEYSDGIEDEQRQIAKRLSEYGANVVLGHGPHVLAPVEVIESENGNETIVWYSLGNFLNAQLPPETLFNGVAVMDIDTETKSLSIEGFLPVYMHYEWTPEEKANNMFLARENFKLYTFDEATEPLERSQNETTLQEQTSRIEEVLNRLHEVKIVSKQDYLD